MKNETKSTALLPGDSVENFRRSFECIGEKIVEAASMLHRLVANDKNVLEELSSGPRAIPESFLNGLLRVAERSLHPQLLLNRCPAYRKISEMAFSTQEEVVKKGQVEVVVGPEDRDVILVDVVKLEGAHLNQVVSSAGIRSKMEQRAWLKSHSTKIVRAASADPGPPYEIKRDRLKIYRGNFELSKVDMLRLLEQMVA